MLELIAMVVLVLLAVNAWVQYKILREITILRAIFELPSRMSKSYDEQLNKALDAFDNEKDKTKRKAILIAHVKGTLMERRNYFNNLEDVTQ